MKKSQHFYIAVILLVTALVLAACGGSDSEGSSGGSGSTDSSDKQVFNMIETAEIPTGDPALATDAASFIVFGQTMEGLYVLDENDTPIPAIADGEPEISEDGKVYTFKLREDAKWSNGDPVTAHDFVYAWRRAIDPDTGSEYAYMFSGIIENATEVMNGEKDPEELSVEAKEDYTLEVTLEQPVEYLNSLLAFGTYLPLNEEFVEEKGSDFGTNSENMLANGPFELTEWNGSGLTWKYVKNDQYWDNENVSLDEVNVQVSKEPSTAVNLFNTDEADRTAALSSEYARQYKDDENASTFKEGSSWYLKFNQERGGEETPLANENIRKALAMAFDKESFTETVLANGSVPSDGYVPEGLAKNPETEQDFREESGDLISYDPEQAKEYWEKGLEELGVEELQLDFLSDDTENAKTTSEYFQNQLETNLEGLSIKLTNVPFKVRLQTTTDQDYDIVMHGWGPDYLDPMTFLDLYVTDGTNNNTGYSSEEYDQLIDDAKVKYANDPEKRWEAMLEAEKLLVQEDTVIAPVYQRGRVVLIKPYVKGLEEHLFGPDYTLKNVTIEK
ncbi:MULTISPECIES: peptide ABC transporter substrate-binding protein [Oceanobacillus]|uniref:Peptide ABC transporter substrate-binding protein n=1 Tax=Oceanobacillus kimchii TaxID=746691 RepID=A0ABQ5TQJ2_9BACI|nr:MULTISPECIES: peptide ABC transporter substrate-binding protein [Oceanobacillus]MBT2599695.1 peptide ABC transporter substrate-binding protein [Oceanobacillus sp. ISL-74]GLO67924.1 peptide ABC transporter substrate-binding protein [Oceanobacillus kimchii]